MQNTHFKIKKLLATDVVNFNHEFIVKFYLNTHDFILLI